MNTNKTSIKQKMVQETPPISFGGGNGKERRTKKRSRKTAEGHIEPYKSGGRTFYRYRRGVDAPEYLGGAELIRRAVKEFKERGNKCQNSQE
ncbi:MAG: hypothetical protein PHG35_02085 [Dehalococcoidales bacterium]|nr:hypothetical protein [Dehalococcoidales bacterium]